MKIITSAVVAMLSLGSLTSSAQGWKWAVHNSSTPFSINTETMETVTDTAGNVFFNGSQFEFSVSPLELAGVTTTYGSFSVFDSTALGQMVIGKLNPSGVFQWVISTKYSDAGAAGNMVTDLAGNLYVFGSYDSMRLQIGNYTLTKNNELLTYFLAKIDPNGNVLWAKNLPASINPAGGEPHEELQVGNGGLGIDNVGNVYVSGLVWRYADSVGSLPQGNNDTITHAPQIYLAKFSPSGNALWAHTVCNAQSYRLLPCTVSPAGSIVLSGNYYTNTMTISATGGPVNLTNPDALALFLAGFDNNGNYLWANSIATASYDYINSVITDKANNIYITGSFIDDSLIFSGKKIYNDSSGANDIFLAKYNASGNLVWVNRAGGKKDDYGFRLALDVCNNLWLTGGMLDLPLSPLAGAYALQFGSDSLVLPYRATRYSDPMFIAQFDTSGHYKMGMTLGSGGDDACGIAVDNKGNFYIAGDWISETTVFGSDTLAAQTGNEYFFMAKYNYDSVGCIPYYAHNSEVPMPGEPDQQISLFPNPACEYITIATDHFFPAGSKAELYDLSGRRINTFCLTGTRTEIPTTALLPGLYMCRIYTSGNATVERKLSIVK